MYLYFKKSYLKLCFKFKRYSIEKIYIIHLRFVLFICYLFHITLAVFTCFYIINLYVHFLYLVTEIWMWLGVVWLYEHRNFFKTH